MNGVVFPAFLRLQVQNDTKNDTELAAAIDRMLANPKRQIREFSAEAQRLFDSAISVQRNKYGALDLGVEQMRQAAQAQQARAVAAREVANALSVTIREEQAYSREMREQVAAARRLAESEEAHAATLRAKATALNQVQQILDRQPSAVSAIVGATKRQSAANDDLASAQGRNRMAMAQLGQQMQDMVIQAQMGTNAVTIFTQQVPQAAYALSGMTGALGTAARFLSGPWGAAIFAGTALLGPFIARLFESGDAAQDAASKYRTAADAARELAGEMNSLKLVEAQINLGKARSRQMELELAISKRPKNPDGTAMFSYRDTQELAALKWQILEQSNLVRLAEQENDKIAEEARKRAERKTRTPRTGRSSGRSLIEEFGEDAAKKLAQIRDGFANLPPEIARSNEAVRQLDDIISDLERRKPEGFRRLVDEAERLKASLPDLRLGQAIDQIVREGEQRLAIERLILQGREDEAQALQINLELESRFGAKAREHADEVLKIVRAQNELAKALEAQRAITDAYLGGIRSARQEIEAILAGQGKIANFQQIFRQVQAKVLTEQIFGPVLNELEEYVKKNTFGPAVDRLSTETDRASRSIGALADAARGGAERLGGSSSQTLEQAFDAVFANRSAANENSGDSEIVVNGIRKATRGTLLALRPETFFETAIAKLINPLVGALDDLLGVQFFGRLEGVLAGTLLGYATAGGPGAALGGLKGLVDTFGETLFGRDTASRLSSWLGTGLLGAQIGTQTSAIADALGIKHSRTGAQIGGIIGELIPGVGGTLGSIAGGLIGKITVPKAAGSLAGAGIGLVAGGPVGALIGSVIGSLVGGLFGKTKAGNAVITNTGVKSGGDLASQAGQAGSAVSDSISKIAQALGAQIGNYAVSIGPRESGWIRVSASGSSRVGDQSFKDAGADLIYNGKSMEEAIRIAITNAIQDGAIAGIKAGTKKLLLAGKDIDAQIQKAVDFESVFKRLRQYKDPIGAALDELNAEFSRLKSIFQEAGATTAEYAQLEELYGIERAKVIKEAQERISSALRDLYSDLNVGDLGLSLRERKANAQAVYDPLRARVAAGDVTAYDDYAAAARTYLDLERQISGSQDAYFALFNDIRSLTGSQIAAQDALVNASASAGSPFSNSAVGGSAPVVGAIGTMQNSIDRQLTLLNENTVNVIRQLEATRSALSEPTLLRAVGYW